MNCHIKPRFSHLPPAVLVSVAFETMSLSLSLQSVLAQKPSDLSDDINRTIGVLEARPQCSARIY